MPVARLEPLWMSWCDHAWRWRRHACRPTLSCLQNNNWLDHEGKQCAALDERNQPMPDTVEAKMLERGGIADADRSKLRWSPAWRAAWSLWQCPRHL